MIQWVRLFVVWMIQTKKQTADYTCNISQQNKTPKTQKIKRTETKLSDVEKCTLAQSCLSFGWFGTKQKTTVWERINFSTQKLLCSVPKTLSIVSSFITKSKRSTNSKRIQTKNRNQVSAPKWSSLCGCLPSGSFKPKTNSRRSYTAVHFTIKEKKKKKKKKKKKNIKRTKKRTFWCWKVEHRSELFVVWMIRNQTKNNPG